MVNKATFNENKATYIDKRMKIGYWVTRPKKWLFFKVFYSLINKLRLCSWDNPLFKLQKS